MDTTENSYPDYPSPQPTLAHISGDMNIISRSKINNILKRRFFIAPSFEIYGGSSGLYDLGPPGAALKSEVESLWRKHFIIHEDMLELSGTCLTPYKVLKASGHVDRFTDLMVRDTVTQEVYRADHYIEDILSNKTTLVKPLSCEISDERREYLLGVVGSMSKEHLGQLYTELGVTSPTGNELSSPYPFNLMFQTQLGSAHNTSEDPFSNVAFLRPETAQGIFVNFRRLLEYNGGKLPFATAQLGTSYRNEIAPRNGLLRVREFHMAEIEHFVHPAHKEHPKFQSVKDMNLPLYPRESQKTDHKVLDTLTLGEALEKKIILNETHAYFLARTYLFLLKCGVQPEGIRFRQHLEDEMSHYASDCWDAELLTSYGWIEVAGHADRSAYDLTCHSQESKQSLTALHRYDNPKEIQFVKTVTNRAIIGKQFKSNQLKVHEALEALGDSEKLFVEQELEFKGSYNIKSTTGDSFEITREMVKFTPATKIISEESFTPHVIEPSFGIGRVLHCILEHTFRTRGIEEQEERCFFAFPPQIAPYKCSILPISNHGSLSALIESLRVICNDLSLTCKLDSTNVSIGKRYARTDEIGIPFAITVDFQSAKDNTVTVRERDSMEQIRISLTEAPIVIQQIVQGVTTWSKISLKYPKFMQQNLES